MFLYVTAACIMLRSKVMKLILKFPELYLTMGTGVVHSI